MGNTQSSAAADGDRIARVGPNAITNPTTPLLLLAAPSIDAQPWRINGTLDADHEESQINRLVENRSSGNQSKHIVYYGLNSTDTTPETQARKLAKHGLVASVYGGGLFEWALLRELYGNTTYGLDNAGRDREALVDPLDFLPQH
jgi:hypothetical protein